MRLNSGPAGASKSQKEGNRGNGEHRRRRVPAAGANAAIVLMFVHIPLLVSIYGGTIIVAAKKSSPFLTFGRRFDEIRFIFRVEKIQNNRFETNFRLKIK